MKTVQYLNALKVKLGISSDYGLQAPLGVTKQAVSKYRNQQSAFEQPVALRVAQLLGLAPEKVLADMELERARSPELQEVWKRIARKVAVVALPAIVAGTIAAVPSPAEASVVRCGSASEGLCIMSTRRYLPGWLAALLAAIAPWLLESDDELAA